MEGNALAGLSVRALIIYIHFMRNVILILFAAGALFAQSDQDFVRDCFNGLPAVVHTPINNPTGMQLSKSAVDSVRSADEPSILQTVDISGTITSVTDSACAEFEDDDGNAACFDRYFFLYGKNKESMVKKITLSNFKAYYETENPMVKALDSNWIFISSEEDVKEGDVVLIKNYSALYADKWVQDICNYIQRVYLAGDVSINPEELPAAIKKRAPANIPTQKFHNRDAAGKTLNNCDARKAKY